MKLLRPLHRRRARRQSQFTVLGNQDLAAFFDVRYDELQNHLEKMDIPFHKDSSGNIWASCQSPCYGPGPVMKSRAAGRK
ncbi:MAG: hypothetical protein ACFHXK_08845 [bacterium]